MRAALRIMLPLLLAWPMVATAQTVINQGGRQTQSTGAPAPATQAQAAAPAAAPVPPAALPAVQPMPTLPALPAPPSGLESVTQSLLPLGPADIRELHKRIDAAKKAASDRPDGLPKPLASTVTVDMSPGATPPLVRVTPYHGAAVNFIDATGTPWPIMRAVNFTGKDFSVEVPIDGGASITINANGFYTNGNVAVYLKDLALPVVVALSSGQREMDYRVDIRIPRRGPNAPAPVMQTETEPQFDKALIELLDGVTPQNARPLGVKGAANTQAWRLGDKLVIRTTLTLREFRSRLFAADRTAVYEVTPRPILLATDENGMTRQIIIEGL
jgi:intracellular multiplication protein IcmK